MTRIDRVVASEDGWYGLTAVLVGLLAVSWLAESAAVTAVSMTAVAVVACLGGCHLSALLDESQETVRQLEEWKANYTAWTEDDTDA